MADELVLIKKAALGDPAAFEELVAPYTGQLAGWLGYSLGEEGQDCLQDTLLAAWLKLPTLDQPGVFKAWLFRIARNRCMDYLRKAQKADRVEVPLETIVGTMGRMPDLEGRPRFDDLSESLTVAERKAVWLFYVDQLPVQEIATRRGVSTGTVKRLLYNARSRMRAGLCQPELEGEKVVSEQKRMRLPESRPQIEIEPFEVQPFEVDLIEQPWFFVPLVAGGEVEWAMFDPPDWRRTDTCRMHVSGQAQVHGLDCLETIQDWDESAGGRKRKNKSKSYVRLAEDAVQTLATLSVRGGVPTIDTFLDEGFVDRWGEKSPRVWRDEGRFAVSGTSMTTLDGNKSSGAGFFQVHIGVRTFQCLRVFDARWATGNTGILVEAYLTREGRTALFRRYNGLQWRRSPDLLPAAQANHRLWLDGAEYIHWYDCLSDYVV